MHLTKLKFQRKPEVHNQYIASYFYIEFPSIFKLSTGHKYTFPQYKYYWSWSSKLQDYLSPYIYEESFIQAKVHECLAWPTLIPMKQPLVAFDVDSEAYLTIKDLNFISALTRSNIHQSVDKLRANFHTKLIGRHCCVPESHGFQVYHH